MSKATSLQRARQFLKGGMLRLALVASLFLLGAYVVDANVYASSATPAAIEVVSAGTPHKAFFAVALEQKNGIAVGAAGAIFTTSDGGHTWIKSPNAPTRLSLFGAAIQGDRAIIVGQQGLILIKSGNAWKQSESGIKTRLLSAAMNAHGVVVVAGEFGTVLVSQDSGETWKVLDMGWPALSSDGLQPHIYSINLAEDCTATIAGELSVIMRKNVCSDESWKVLHSAFPPPADQIDPNALPPAAGSNASIFSLSLRQDGVGVAVGQSGSILRTTDSGQTWTQVSSGSDAILLGVTAADGSKFVAAGIRDMLVSADDGLTWRHLTGPAVSSFWYSGIVYDNAVPSVIAVGQAGRIVRSPVD